MPAPPTTPVFDPPRHDRPRPHATSLNEPFWEATRNGRLVVQRCDECATWRWTPQLACPACWSEAYTWTETCGRGTVYSYTIVRRSIDPSRFEAPYILAVVKLDEGPHMLTNLVDCEPDEVEVDMTVTVRFERVDDEFTVYPFAPVRDA